MTEFTENAIIAFYSSSNVSFLLQLKANFYWLVDTSITFHITSYYYQFKSYSPCRRVVQLADNFIIYLARVRSVIFEPVVKEKQTQEVEFSQVLHVPDLKSNLLSYLYFTYNKKFEIYISLYTMLFKLEESTLFIASIYYTNSVILNGTIITSEIVFSISTISSDILLWYHYFIYHNYVNIQKIIK